VTKSRPPPPKCAISYFAKGKVAAAELGSCLLKRPHLIAIENQSAISRNSHKLSGVLSLERISERVVEVFVFLSPLFQFRT